jgi:hypothetical protein
VAEGGEAQSYLHVLSWNGKNLESCDEALPGVSLPVQSYPRFPIFTFLPPSISASKRVYMRQGRLG